jgi:hypothetical protein
MDVLKDGNQSGLKLQRFKATFAPASYIPDDESAGYDAESKQWLTVRGMIGDIWKSFRFEPFHRKMEMLFKASDYPLEPASKAEVIKHILLRNCVEHHDGQLTNDALSQSGCESLNILLDDGNVLRLTAWKRIILSLVEVKRFGELLQAVARTYYAHSTRRIKARVWVSTEYIEAGTSI